MYTQCSFWLKDIFAGKKKSNYSFFYLLKFSQLFLIWQSVVVVKVSKNIKEDRRNLHGTAIIQMHLSCVPTLLKPLKVNHVHLDQDITKA